MGVSAIAPAAASPSAPLTIHSAGDVLSEMYCLLDTLLTAATPEEPYSLALRRVLQAAHASEAHGFPLALLPLLTCQAAGGDPLVALPAAAAWRALHIGLKLLDDVEDGDVARLNDDANPAQVINLSTGFLTAAQLALTRLPAATCTALQPDLLHTVLRMAAGQHRDLCRADQISLSNHWAVIEAKSGVFFALAASSGATCATLDVNEIARFQALGHHLGVLIQILDDWVDTHQTGGLSDLATGQPSLLVCYALTVASPSERERLQALLSCAPLDVEAERTARRLMAQLGCEAYIHGELTRYRRRILSIFGDNPALSPTVQPLYDWFLALDSTLSSRAMAVV